ncbi:MAG: hypothetical protein JNG84_06720 [Archangium sp.]|nr:hypothetical protein [Archangium sp.]
MSRFLIALALAVTASSAWARPWSGIEPGVASSIDVVAKFGDPSRKAAVKGKQVLVYSGEQAMKATMQVQFKIDPTTQVVERIDVYPDMVIDVSAVEKTYGPACTGTKKDDDACYFKRQSDSKRAYYLYAKLGLAIFFKDDGKTVQMFAFLPPATPE